MCKIYDTLVYNTHKRLLKCIAIFKNQFELTIIKNFFSADILIPAEGSVSSPVCVVSTFNVMTETGWTDLQNITEQFQQPFQLFKEGKRTLLQVVGLPHNIQYSYSSLLLNPYLQFFVCAHIVLLD